MQSVLVDLHKTEAVLYEGGYSSGAYHDVEAKAYYLTLQKHHITQAQFDSSLVWYTHHPQLFDKIYPKVVAQLQEERDAFNEQFPESEEQEPEKPRVLPDWDRNKFMDLYEIPVDWLDFGEKDKKTQKSDEKFVYVKINS